MKLLLNFILLWVPMIVLAQNHSAGIKISYDYSSKGKKIDNELSIIYRDDIAYQSAPNDKIKNYSDFKNNENISAIAFDGKLFKTITPFDSLSKPTFSNKIETILGYKCQFASYSYFSNKIEVWFTEEAKAKGSPYSNYLPSNKALVLKLVINGDREIKAKSITKIKDDAPTYSRGDGYEISQAEFNEIKIKSQFTKLQVFKDEIINFDPNIKPFQDDILQLDSTYHFSKGSVVLKKIKLSPELRSSGKVFAKLSCKSNGDAYDRTGSVFIIPGSKNITVLNAYQFGLDKLPVFKDNKGQEYQGIIMQNNYEPPIEIMRFFTSFGAGYFNEKRIINNYDWKDEVIYKQEIASLIPSNENEIWVGVFIGNYDKGGHQISLELDFHPSNEKQDSDKTEKYIQPLFSTINTLEMSGQNYGKLFDNDTLKVAFEITEKIESLQLLFTSTGHGGWGGGDEFNPKLNRILVDGEEVFKIYPWRTDCASYRLSNPASGNFGDGTSSSDLSRSNWCPGILTPPYLVPLENLKIGMHTLEVIIDQGKDDGNSWGVTGVLTGEIILMKDKINAKKI